MGGVYEIVFPSSHNVIPVDIEFEDWDLQRKRFQHEMCAIEDVGWVRTYTAVSGRVYTMRHSAWCHGGQTDPFFGCSAVAAVTRSPVAG